MPPYGPVASSVRIINIDDKNICLQRVHLNAEDKIFSLRLDQWYNSQWIQVPVNTQLSFI